MRLYVIAGEVSGDRLGGALLAGLHQLSGDLEIHGVGGPVMAAQGLNSQFSMDELSVMGIAEVLPKYRALKRRIRECADEVLRLKPDVLITIDSPDFCLRVAKLVKAESDIKTVHYVAPSVWAWREGRAAKMAQVIDHVLALLPFEPPLMRAAGMGCDFVGHPVVAEPVVTAQECAEFRALHGIGTDPLLLVLPGSRRGEVERLSPIFGVALKNLLRIHPRIKIILPAAAPVAARVRELVAGWDVPVQVIDPDHADAIQQKRAAFGAADLALAASGTVSLELAAAQTPMVISYDMNWFSRVLISKLLKVDSVTLVNLVSETRSVPEFLGKNCVPEAIAKGLEQVLSDPQGQIKAMKTTMERLGKGQNPPGVRAAQAVLNVVAAD